MSNTSPFRRALRFPRPGDPDHEVTPHPEPERFRGAELGAAMDAAMEELARSLKAVAAACPSVDDLLTPRCECAENGRVCRACRERNRRWRHPLAPDADEDDRNGTVA